MQKTIDQLAPEFIRGKRCLLRVDFNAPLKEDLTIADDSRIRASLPTIKFLVAAGAKIVLVSHLGRPNGQPNEKYSLKPVAARLSELLKCRVQFFADCVGADIADQVEKMANGSVSLLENVRFHAEEEKNDLVFARKLANLADFYVNDAFGSAHRAHASTDGVTRYLKPAVAGLLMNKELKALSGALNNPVKPFATVIGGAKVSSKIGVLENLISKVDILVIGGAMAFTFLKAQGKEVGRSLVEDDRLDLCRNLLDKAKAQGVDVILPSDVVCAPAMQVGVPISVHSVDSIPEGQMGLDIGPETVSKIEATLSRAKTIVWNGPLGVFEVLGFEAGTYSLIDLLVQLTKSGVKTIVGGGDSLSALEAKHIGHDSFSHVSTGGGACLEFLEGLELPGVACLDQAEMGCLVQGKLE